ncbi:Gfo/Idh/MocA family oxidoreductase [Geminicoccaceae bacterium 1502E]|nr:Gfo/Idh/MocA family oxidoreductase [Geminicoccaceae bacterium 1502E]
MKVVLVGSSHWHAPLVLAGLHQAGIEVAAVWDEDAARARADASALGCPAFADLEMLLERVRPDLAFALGRHCAMPSIARTLIAHGVPFSLEKPGGLTADAVAALAREAGAAGVFSTVPFVNRLAPWLKKIEALQRAGRIGPVLQASFTDIAGPPERYRAAGCAWMLDPAQAGGGVLVNLGIHFLDLARCLGGRSLAVAGAVLSHAAFAEAVEDHALVALEDGQGFSAHIEVGYGFPHAMARHQAYRFAGRNWHLAIERGLWRLATPHGVEEEPVATDAAPLMATHVAATFEAVRGKTSPTATLDDLAAALRLVEAACRRPSRS